MVLGLPYQYCFVLRCCHSRDCLHPFCLKSISRPASWFPGGPSLSYIPFPILDPDQPWGSTTCIKCTGRICYGHFLKPEEAETSSLTPMLKPPSTIIKEAFSKSTEEECKSIAFIQDLAKKCLLPPDEVQIWLDHLLLC